MAVTSTLGRVRNGGPGGISKSIPFVANAPPDLTFTGFNAEGYVPEAGSEALATLARAHLASYAAPLETFVTPGCLDGRGFVIYANIPCVVFGPYSLAIHGFDKRVKLSSVKRVTGAIALFIAEWCGSDAVGPFSTRPAPPSPPRLPPTIPTRSLS